MSSTQFTWDELASITEGSWLVEPTAGDGVSSVSTDTRKIGQGDLFLCLRGERFDGHDFGAGALDSGAAALCCSLERADLIEAAQATGAALLLVNDTLTAFQTLGGAHRRRFNTIPVVAITGSSGKTSTKEMIATVLSQGFGGEVLATIGNTNNLIGVPQNLLRLSGEYKAAVLELGTNAPGEIETLVTIVEPTCAVLTSVGPGHLEGLGTVAGVAAEKSAIFSTLTATDGAAILPEALAENPIINAALPPKAVTVGAGASADVRIDYQGGDLANSTFTISAADSQRRVEWGITGAHQAANAGLAAAVGLSLGLSIDAIVSALADCQLPGMRMKVIANDAGRWINDAYNANPDSARALVDWLATVEVDSLAIVLGDMLELGPSGPELHRELLVHTKQRLPGARIIAIGPLMSGAAGGLADDCYPNAEAARNDVRALAEAGALVALKGSRGMGLETILQGALSQ